MAPWIKVIEESGAEGPLKSLYEGLRGKGLSDGAILHTVEIASYFNYINRIADALGVELDAWEPED